MINNIKPQDEPSLENIGITVRASGLIATKTADKKSANPGDVITYSIGLTNVGSEMVYLPKINDILPEGLTFVPGSVEYNGEPEADGIFSDIRLPNLAPNKSLTVQFQAQVDEDAEEGAILSNTATFDCLDIFQQNEYSVTTNAAAVIIGTFSVTTLLAAKNAIGAALEGGEFEFGLYKAGDDTTPALTARSDADGLISFGPLYLAPGQYDYTIKEITPGAGWDADGAEYPVHISVAADGTDTVTYPAGSPVFKNIDVSDPSGLVKFEELEFDKAGDYTFYLKETTPSGNDWTMDDSEYPVTVHVVADAFGNLVATAEYPNGYPHFVNTRDTSFARITLSARKTAIGASLKDGQFTFGLFKEGDDTNPVLTATNGSGIKHES